MRQQQQMTNLVDRGKLVLATAILLSIFLTWLFSVQLCQASNPFFSTQILSPTNSTYDTERIVLETVTNGLTGANVHYSVNYSLDGKENVTVPFTVESHQGSFQITMTGCSTLPLLPDGSHHVTVCQEVEADSSPPMAYSERYTIDFTVDDQSSPSILSLSIGNKTYTQDTLQLNFTLDSPTCWIGYSLDKQSNVTVVGNTTLTNLPAGSHDIQIFANDTVGNMANTNITYFTISQPSNNIDSNQTNIILAIAATVTLVVVYLAILKSRSRQVLK
jgi:hypothetical protein